MARQRYRCRYYRTGARRVQFFGHSIAVVSPASNYRSTWSTSLLVFLLTEEVEVPAGWPSDVAANKWGENKRTDLEGPRERWEL